jgi:hypothetical protein
MLCIEEFLVNKFTHVLEKETNMYADIDQEIREVWFKNHQAKLTQHGDLQVLEWKEQGTSMYYCRYVFDGNKMYISGDIGEAIFWLTWKASVHSFDDINLGYFESKLAAYSEDRRDFNGRKALERIKEWKSQLDEEEEEYDTGEMDGLIASVESCSSKNEWAHEYVNGVYHDFISDIDQDYWEWIYDIGDEIPARIRGYLTGLKMASEQLKVA